MDNLSVTVADIETWFDNMSKEERAVSILGNHWKRIALDSSAIQYTCKYQAMRILCLDPSDPQQELDPRVEPMRRELLSITAKMLCIGYNAGAEATERKFSKKKKPN